MRATAGRTTLTLSGAVADIERAFGLHLRLWSDAKGIFYAPDHDPELAGVLGNISSIVGFTNAGRWWSHRKDRPANTIPTPPQPKNGYGYAGLRTLYDAPTGTNAPLGEGERVAILGVGAPELEGDMLPSGTAPNWNTPQLADINQYLGAASPSPELYTQIQVGDSGAADAGDVDTYGENTLDAEMVMTFAPKAQVDHVLVVDNEYGLFSDGIAFIVNDPTESTARAVSLSYGTCESGDPTQFPIINALLAQALTEGQQWFVAAGDSGTDDCEDGPSDPVLTVDWPGSSPYAFSVGGTQISGKKKTGFFETVWGDNYWDDGAGGGGASQVFSKRSGQVGVTPDDNARDVPDVSALAANPGIDEIQGGTDDPSYGTSCAAPLWAGIWAVVDEASNSGHGFAQGPIDLYARAPAGGIVDINPTVSNSNAVGTPPGGYSTGPGYDQATGLGVPDVAKLVLQTTWQ